MWSTVENVNSLCKVYGENVDKLKNVLSANSLRMSKFGGVEWRVDYVLSSSHVKVHTHEKSTIFLHVVPIL